MYVCGCKYVQEFIKWYQTIFVDVQNTLRVQSRAECTTVANTHIKDWKYFQYCRHVLLSETFLDETGKIQKKCAKLLNTDLKNLTREKYNFVIYLSSNCILITNLCV